MISNEVVSAEEYALLCNRSSVVVFCESCRFYCEEDGEGVCSLLSLFAEGGRVVFHVLPHDFCAWGKERAD